jgi:hypothetical protein
MLTLFRFREQRQIDSESSFRPKVSDEGLVLREAASCRAITLVVHDDNVEIRGGGSMQN